jgi:TPR repeat protein
LPGQDSELSISLVSLDGTVLAERRMMLQIAPTGATAIATRAASVAVEPSAAEAKVAAPETPPPMLISPEEEAQRLKRGDDALALSDVAGARLIFEHLAAHGSATGAFKLAQTHDPQLLSRLPGGAMMRPDPEVAARWYAKAAAMGHAGAREKIAGSR